MGQEAVLRLLQQDPRFQRASPVERKRILLEAGFDEPEADQTIIDLSRAAPAGPSMMLEGPPGGFLQRMARGAGRLTKEAGPATAGAVLGGMAAPLLRIQRPLGQAFGGAIFEAARQLLTDAPFSPEQIVGAAVVPSVAGKVTPLLSRGAIAALPSVAKLGDIRIPPVQVRSVAKFIPGTAGAFADIAQEQVKTIPGRIRGAIPRLVGTDVPANELIEAGLSAPGQALLTNTARAVAEVRAKDILKGFPLDINEKVLEPLEAFLEEAAANGGRVSIRDMNTLRSTVGEFFGGIKTQGPQKVAAKRIIAGVLQDLDDAAETGVEGAAQLRQGLDAARLEFAARDFEDLLETTGLGIIRQGERAPVFRLNRVLTELDKVRRGRPSRDLQLFAGAFKGEAGKQELDDIIDLVGKLNETVKVLPPPKGQQVGSSQNLLFGAGGLALAEAFGQPPAMGAAAAIGIKEITTRLLMSKAGREALREALTEGVEFDLLQAVTIFLGNLAQQDLLEGGSVRQLMQRFQQPQLQAPDARR